MLGITRKNTGKDYYLPGILKAIENNCEIKNSRNLIRDLEKVFNTEEGRKSDTKEKNLLEILPVKNIKVADRVENWQQAMRISGQILIDNNYAGEDYIESVIEMINKHGTYMVLKNNFILGHGNRLKNKKKAGLSFLFLKEAVEFPENNFINCVIVLCSRDKKEHTFGLLELHRIIDNYDLYKKISDKNFPAEIHEVIKLGREKIKK